MSRIDDENEKTLRPAMSVIVGMDIPTVNVSASSATGNYSGTSETLNGSPERVILMDLIGDGFLNDGSAEPLSTEVGGYLSSKGTNLTLTITLDESSNDDLVIIDYVNGVLEKRTFTGSGSTRTATIPASDTERYRISRAIVGNAWWYDNDTLISCTLNLRGVETKLDNPQLQMSDIEFVGYEPNDITDKIGSIGTEYPIYYTAGYYGDMSPVRKFYLGQQLEWNDNQIKIHGYDATYKLDELYDGVYVGNASTGLTGGGLRAYFDKIDAMVTAAGIQHTYDTTGTDDHFNAGSPFLLQNKPKREIIAQAVNMYRTVMHYVASGPDPVDDIDIPIYFSYVDAGIPQMKIGQSTEIKTIKDTTKPTVTVEPIISTIAFNNYLVEVAPSNATIETRQAANTQIVPVMDPYYSFSATGATITKLSPYKYKIVPTAASQTINGRRIYLGAVYDSDLPLTYSNGANGIEVTLPDVCGPYEGVAYVSGSSTYGVRIWDTLDQPEALEHLLSRSNLLYTFDFRGDPRLQPRDYIQIDVDDSGVMVPMTIETIDITHADGGTISTIKARKGLI